MFGTIAALAKFISGVFAVCRVANKYRDNWNALYTPLAEVFSCRGFLFVC
jgi:hypothetical protein